MALDTDEAKAYLEANNVYHNGIITTPADEYKDLYVCAPFLDPHDWDCPEGWGAFPANNGNGVGFAANPTYVMAVAATAGYTAPGTVGKMESKAGVYAIKGSPGAEWIDDNCSCTEISVDSVDGFVNYADEYEALTGESEGTSSCGNNEDTQMTDGKTITLASTEVNANDVLDALSQFDNINSTVGEAGNSGNVVITGDELADSYVYVFVDGSLVTKRHNVCGVTDVMPAWTLKEMAEDAMEDDEDGFVSFLESELSVEVTTTNQDEMVFHDNVDAEVKPRCGSDEFFSYSNGRSIDDHDDVGIRYIATTEDDEQVLGVVDSRGE